MAYHLELPPKLPRVHNTFHVSQLLKYVPNLSHVIMLDPIQLKEDLSNGKQLVCIVDQWKKQLRRTTVPLIKVLWENHEVSEAT